MILPVGASSFSEAMRMGAEVYHNLKSGIKKKYGQAGTPRQHCLQFVCLSPEAWLCVRRAACQQGVKDPMEGKRGCCHFLQPMRPIWHTASSQISVPLPDTLQSTVDFF